MTLSLSLSLSLTRKTVCFSSSLFDVLSFGFFSQAHATTLNTHGLSPLSHVRARARERERTLRLKVAFSLFFFFCLFSPLLSLSLSPSSFLSAPVSNAQCSCSAYWRCENRLLWHCGRRLSGGGAMLTMRLRPFQLVHLHILSLPSILVGAHCESQSQRTRAM
jgi:hypothetical protein